MRGGVNSVISPFRLTKVDVDRLLDIAASPKLPINRSFGNKSVNTTTLSLIQEDPLNHPRYISEALAAYWATLKHYQDQLPQKHLAILALLSTDLPFGETGEAYHLRNTLLSTKTPPLEIAGGLVPILQFIWGGREYHHAANSLKTAEHLAAEMKIMALEHQQQDRPDDSMETLSAIAKQRGIYRALHNMHQVEQAFATQHRYNGHLCMTSGFSVIALATLTALAITGVVAIGAATFGIVPAAMALIAAVGLYRYRQHRPVTISSFQSCATIADGLFARPLLSEPQPPTSIPQLTDITP